MTNTYIFMEGNRKIDFIYRTIDVSQIDTPVDLHFIIVVVKPKQTA